MRGQARFFDLDHRLKELSAKGDRLERLSSLVDFELFRPDNERHLAGNGLRSQIHRKKPPGKPTPVNISRANRAKSKVRTAVEHVFARRKRPMALVVGTIGLANLVYNMNRAVWLVRQTPEPA